MISPNKMAYFYHVWKKYDKNTIVIIPWPVDGTCKDYMLLCLYEPFNFIWSIAWSSFFFDYSYFFHI